MDKQIGRARLNSKRNRRESQQIGGLNWSQAQELTSDREWRIATTKTCSGKINKQTRHGSTDYPPRLNIINNNKPKELINNMNHKDSTLMKQNEQRLDNNELNMNVNRIIQTMTNNARNNTIKTKQKTENHGSWHFSASLSGSAHPAPHSQTRGHFCAEIHIHVFYFSVDVSNILTKMKETPKQNQTNRKSLSCPHPRSQSLSLSLLCALFLSLTVRNDCSALLKLILLKTTYI